MVIKAIEDGKMLDLFLPFENKRLLPRGSGSHHRLYATYTLPESEGGGQVLVRLHGTESDYRRSIKRMEHLRAFSKGDPDWPLLYHYRSTIESVNAVLERTLWLGRAHSDGQRRPLVDLLGFALWVNSRALGAEARGRQAQHPSAALSS